MNLALLLEEEADSIAPLRYFHFLGDNLHIVYQVGQPQTLFQTTQQQSEKQFLWVQFGHLQQYGADVLKVEAGFHYDPEEEYHRYLNLGGGLVTTQRMRVTNDEIELIIVNEKGIIYVSSPLCLPDVIKEITDIEVGK